MPEKIKNVQPPSGVSRILFRLPIWLYQHGLGKLFGRRFLELTHIGRRSGQLRHTVLEVVRYNGQTNTYYIAAGFGQRSDWFQNIVANPAVVVNSAGMKNPAIAVRLSDAEAGEELVQYAHDYPLVFRELVRFMGYRLDGSEEDIRGLGQYLPMFAIKTDEVNVKEE